MNEKDIERIANKIFEKLKDSDEIKKEKALSPFQKTEKLLSEFSLLKGAIDVKRIFIEDLQKEKSPLQNKNAGVSIQVSKKYLSEFERKENQIEKLELEIKKLQNIIDITERALETIKENKYYKVIELKYFDDMTFEYIAEKLNISIVTAKRHRNMMIRQLQIIIFSDDVIKSILN